MPIHQSLKELKRFLTSKHRRDTQERLRDQSLLTSSYACARITTAALLAECLSTVEPKAVI